MMDLDEVLRAVETGTSGQSHAEWLQVQIQWFQDSIDRWAEHSIKQQHGRSDSRAWASTWKQAAKWYWRTSNEWGDMLDSCHEYIQKRRAERDEARAWAIRMMQSAKQYHAVWVDQLKWTDEADTRAKELRAELKARDERRCETCRHFGSFAGGGEHTTTRSTSVGYCRAEGTWWRPDEWCCRWEA